MKKRILCIILALVFSVSVISCADTATDNTDQTSHSEDEKADDLSDDGIAAETKDFLERLDENITIYVVVAQNERDRQLDTFLRSYAKYSDKIKIKYVDPEENPDFVNEHFDMSSEEFCDSIDHNSVVVESAKRSKTVKYLEIYKYSDQQISEYYSNQYYYNGGLEIQEAGIEPEIFDADYEITSAIKYVMTDDLPTAYLLTGHGEAPLAGTISSIISAQSVTLTQLSLTEDGTVPIGADAVVINVPASDITEAEAEALNAYIDGGGSVILVTDVKTYTRDGMPNLTSVANHCGLDAEEGVVIDPDDGRHDNRNEFMLIEPLESCSVTEGMADPSEYAVMLERPHAITEAEDYGGSMAVSPVIKSSRNSLIIGVDEEYPGADGDSEGGREPGEYYLGAVSNDAATGASFTWFSTSYMTSDMGAQYNNSVIFALAVTSVCEIEY